MKFSTIWKPSSSGTRRWISLAAECTIRSYPRATHPMFFQNDESMLLGCFQWLLSVEVPAAGKTPKHRKKTGSKQFDTPNCASKVRGLARKVLTLPSKIIVTTWPHALWGQRNSLPNEANSGLKFPCFRVNVQPLATQLELWLQTWTNEPWIEPYQCTILKATSRTQGVAFVSWRLSTTQSHPPAVCIYL